MGSDDTTKESGLSHSNVNRSMFIVEVHEERVGIHDGRGVLLTNA